MTAVDDQRSHWEGSATEAAGDEQVANLFFTPEGIADPNP